MITCSNLFAKINNIAHYIAQVSNHVSRFKLALSSLTELFGIANTSVKQQLIITIKLIISIDIQKKLGSLQRFVDFDKTFWLSLKSNNLLIFVKKHVVLGRPFQEILVISPAHPLELADHLECHNNEVAYLFATYQQTYSQQMINKRYQIKTYS